MVLHRIVLLPTTEGLHLDDTLMPDSVDTVWRKVRVNQDDFSSALYGKSQITLLKLAVEVQLRIVDQFDLAQPVDVEALKSLSRTCKQLHFIVQDNVRLAKSFKNQLHYEKKILTNFKWRALGDAAGYSRYADYCRYLVRNVVGPMVRPCPEAYDIPLNGWDQLLSVALLVRAKLMGFGLDKPSTQLHRDQRDFLCLRYQDPEKTTVAERTNKLTSVERLTLLYGTLLWQQTYAYLTQPTSVQRTEMTGSLGGSSTWVFSLESAFVMEGPLFLLRMWYGWQPNFQAVGWLDQLTMYNLAKERFNYWCKWRSDGAASPMWFLIVRRAKHDIHTWKDELSLKKPTPFTEVGLEKEAAQTLLECLEVWCALDILDLPWFNFG
ncbi:hypothetical protein LTR70_005241 [Exophiala xenobiotica]|uniref:F-box domain-containing protein n=1 Tax=Lithohypha guttulata TaxID=1690604 RepID=A0ABR0KB07_9EURO|nr:hypothetical protein LTR24_004954 [Lithohypha guttulata]KAK5318806.1 hypothetical protein LTR70_005241 [Exophiala xenobiotica]